MKFLATLTFGAILFWSLPSFSQTSSTFPGRRIGGATRGSCTHYLIANIIPSSNTISLGASDYFTLLYSSNMPPDSQISIEFASDKLLKLYSFAPTSQQGLLSIPLSLFPPGSYIVKSTSICSAKTDALSSSPAPATSQIIITDNISDTSSSLYSRIGRLVKSRCNSSVPKLLLLSDFASIELLTLFDQESVAFSCIDK